jgi:hypothetical protein
MAAKTTRTLNPLHFEDLEPHRFEDLVRQLVYDFRTWKSLEAIGRSGADEGTDVLGTEIFFSDSEIVDGANAEPSVHRATGERQWIVQCKREKEIGPAKLREIIAESLPEGGDPPYGLIIAAACDFSKKARSAFREEMIGLHIEEFYLWGKGELEDMLFLPKNDHLLFAYFGISIQIVRRSMKSRLAARLAIKRRLLDAHIVNGDPMHPPWIFLLDPREERYPSRAAIPDFQSYPRWGWFQTCRTQHPNQLCLIQSRCLGMFDPSTNTWDSLSESEQQNPQKPPKAASHLIPISAFHLNPSIEAGIKRERERNDARQQVHQQWIDATKEDQRYYIDRVRFIHYDRILAVDAEGDTANDGPHLFVEFDPVNGPFEQRELLIATSDATFSSHCHKLDPEKKVGFFNTKAGEAEKRQPT